MNGKIAKLFAMVMVLALVVSLSATGIVYDTESTEAAGIMKWLKVPIPNEADFQLYPDTDVSAIALTPSGDTIFAAVGPSQNVTDTGDWRVMVSYDGGFSWDETRYHEDINAVDDGGIVDLVVAPNWDMGPNFRYLYVATTEMVHKGSGSSLSTFSTMGMVAGDHKITGIDVAYTDRGYEVLVGTYGPDGDVFLWNDAWIPQGVDSGLAALYGVHDVAFSPLYRDDDMIFAIVDAAPALLQDQTMMRIATDPARVFGDVANWGGYVSDAPFYQSGTLTAPIFCDVPYDVPLPGRARMTFADDFESDMASIFVGLTAYGPCTLCAGTCSTGDAFLVSIVTTFIVSSDIEDLEIRGGDSATNVWSIAVSGNAASANILAGLRELNIEGPPTSWTSSVHYSTNGGTSWLQSYKPPSGITAAMLALDCVLNVNQCKTNVIVAPDFQTSGMAYAATMGHFSGVWVSTTDGTTWNGRGLLDYMGDYEISDIEPSPRYATDNTIFMVGAMNQTFDPDPLGVLWQTADEGNTWEMILAMNALFPLPGINVDNVELAVNYPDDKYIFVSGHSVAQAPPVGDIWFDSTRILGSADGGNTFTIPVGTDEFVVDHFVALGGSEIVAAGWHRATGEYNVWKTSRTAYNWDEAMGLPRLAAITDLEVYGKSILVGTGPAPARGYGYGPAPAFPWHAAEPPNGGEVYICHDYLANFGFIEMGNDVGTLGDEVSIAFDTEYFSNDIIYAASTLPPQAVRVRCGATRWAEPCPGSR